MEFRELKIVPNRKQCDLCERAAPPIVECQFPYGAHQEPPHEPRYSGVRQWIDLCPDCRRVLRAEEQRFATLTTFTADPPEYWRGLHAQEAAGRAQT